MQPGTRFGPHEVTALIGAWGTGGLYRARAVRCGRDVRTKVPAADLLRASAQGCCGRRFLRTGRRVVVNPRSTVQATVGLPGNASGRGCTTSCSSVGRRPFTDRGQRRGRGYHGRHRHGHRVKLARQTH